LAKTAEYNFEDEKNNPFKRKIKKREIKDDKKTQ